MTAKALIVLSVLGTVLAALAQDSTVHQWISAHPTLAVALSAVTTTIAALVKSPLGGEK